MSVNRDPNTLSNYTKYRVTHTVTNFSIDFEQGVVKGDVVHKVRSIAKSTKEPILLDTDHLDIQEVKVNGSTASWELVPESKPYGQAMKISLDQNVQDNDDWEISISLRTTKGTTALQFMTPTQARSKYPYVFSQCQSINARSIFPCQDTPDVKSTYEFNIVSPLQVLTSGLSVGPKEGVDTGDGAGRLFRFKQDIPIPSYLFALTSGDIQTAPIGPRSVVATGPAGLKAAQWEFEESTERYIQEIEKIIFPYQWTTYNLLVVPPSFPYGGMENPVFTYCTPTIVSGDRENVDVIAHELSHSWSGNLVTNASWEHFWLNEGWTTYLERRLQAAVHGPAFRDFSAIIGWKSLEDSVNDYGQDHEFTKLIPNMKGQHPDDSFSSVPYDKGYTFLTYLEQQVTQKKWDKFIPHYFTTFAKKSIDSFEFKKNLLDFFASDAEASAALAAVDWDKWFYSPGLPPKPHFDTSLTDVCFALAAKWEHATPETFSPRQDDVKGWRANQVVVFLDQVLTFEKPLATDQAHLMGQVYNLVETHNVEVSSRYFRVALRAKDEAVFKPTADLLANVGRMKFVRPLYKELNAVNRPLAVETFEKNKDFYHPICKAMVEKDLFGQVSQK